MFQIDEFDWFHDKVTNLKRSRFRNSFNQNKMNSKVLSLIIFASFLNFSVNAKIPVFVYKAAGQILTHLMGDEIKKASFKLHRKLEKTMGKDVSVGDIATMDVEMVNVVEPYQKHAIVTDFLVGKAVSNRENLEPIIKALRKKRALENISEAQIFLNELVGIYIVLNESETASTEVLLSAKPCLLSSTDHYFRQEPDPCKAIAKESVSKMIGRFEDIEKLKGSMGESLKVPSEWDNHRRQIYFRLDSYINELPLSKMEKSNWAKIKDFIDSKRVL